MLFPAMSNFSNQDSSLCPANGRQTVGDGAFTFDNEPSVLAVCHLQGTDDMYYYSTTFSGGPGVCGRYPLLYHLFFLRLSFYSGAFDVPKAKCPPDRGSLDCVTGSPASSLFSSHLTDWPSSPSSPASTNSIIYNSQATIPRAIPRRNHSTSSTPPLTPDNGSDYLKGNDSIQGKDALDFLMTVFPHQGMSVLPHAKSVSISAPNLGSEFNGVVLDIPGSTKTLYVDGKSAKSVSLRESIVALLDLADESLGCSSLVIILERSSPNLGVLLHSLMYVGGTVVTKPPYKVDPAFVLVGLEV